MFKFNIEFDSKNCKNDNISNKNLNEEIYKSRRDAVNKAKFDQSMLLDKTLISLCTWAFTASMYFIYKINDYNFLWLLISSWVLLLASLIIVITSFYISDLQIDNHIQELDNGIKWIKNIMLTKKLNNTWKQINRLKICSIITLLLWLLLLWIFLLLNINNMQQIMETKKNIISEETINPQRTFDEKDDKGYNPPRKDEENNDDNDN